MTPSDKRAARDALPLCKTLSDAELLIDLDGRVARWGIFDGWTGRPRSTAGLSVEKKPDRAIEHEYHAAYDVGAKLRISFDSR